MIRLGSLLVLMASIGFVSATEAPYADDVKKEDYRFVIAIDRSAGNKNPEGIEPIDYYRFTVVRDGSWEFKPLKGEFEKGKLGAEELNEWLEAIEDGGIDTVESDPSLGALDESYMDVTVQTKDRKTRVRMLVSGELSQAIEKKIVEVVKPGN